MPSDAPRQRKGMWEKLKNKREVEREHESNFKAGRVDIQERNLHRTGIRGRKRYIYYACLYLLGILCFINLVMLCIVLSVLKIDKSGMESLSLFQSGLVRFMRSGDLQHVVIKPGEIGAFAGQNLSFVGQNAPVNFTHAAIGGSVASFGPNKTVLQSKNGVRIVSTDVNKTILHITDREVVWDVPAKAKHLDTTTVVSYRITSDDNKDLWITGRDKKVTIQGNENLFVDCGNLTLSAANGDIAFSAGAKSTLSFSAASGYRFLDIRKSDVITTPTTEKTYRLCYCPTSQKLFKIEMKPNVECVHAISPPC